MPTAYTSESASLLKTIGITGFKVIVRALLTFVGANYIGAMFFSWCGSVIHENPVGLIFNFTSFILSRPLRSVEIILNGLVLRPISKLVRATFYFKWYSRNARWQRDITRRIHKNCNCF